MLLVERSECYSDAMSGLPDEPATLFCAAVKQLKPRRKRDSAINLQTGTASGVINYCTINNGGLRADDDLGDA